MSDDGGSDWALYTAAEVSASFIRLTISTEAVPLHEISPLGLGVSPWKASTDRALPANHSSKIPAQFALHSDPLIPLASVPNAAFIMLLNGSKLNYA